MSKRLERYIMDRNYHTSDEEILRLCPDVIGIFYGFNNYMCNVTHIKELVDAVHAEYPEIKEEDMNIWYVEKHMSIRHAGYTVLRVSIPTIDYLKMRKNHEIGIL